jgi:hypothetical protein
MSTIAYSNGSANLVDPPAPDRLYVDKDGLDLPLRVLLGLLLGVLLQQDPRTDPLVRLTAQVRAALNRVCRAATDPPTGSLLPGLVVAYA